MGHHQNNLRGITVLFLLFICDLRFSKCQNDYCNCSSEYTISPSCSMQPCLTLSRFAANLSHYLQSSVYLNLLPGNHVLDSQISISNTENFYLSANPNSTQNVSVTCMTKFARFEFDNVSEVHINGLTSLDVKTMSQP